MRILGFALLIFSFELQAKCLEMQRAYWSYIPSEKKAEFIELKTEKLSFCEPLSQDPQSNVRLKIVHKEQSFIRSLFLNMNFYWDFIEDGVLKGGSKELDEVFFDSPVPSWAKGGEFYLYDIKSGKELARGRM